MICGLGLPQSNIRGMPINWRSPEKVFLTFFFLEHLRLCIWSLTLASSIPVLGLQRVCPRKGCPWPWIFFVSLVLASSLVSSTPLLQNMFFLKTCCSDFWIQITKLYPTVAKMALKLLILFPIPYTNAKNHFPLYQKKISETKWMWTYDRKVVAPSNTTQHWKIAEKQAKCKDPIEQRL